MEKKIVVEVRGSDRASPPEGAQRGKVDRGYGVHE